MLMKTDKFVFALDIGTRTVIGIIAQIEEENLKIVAQSITEHQSRAVFDGQIHDVLKVAQAVKKIKNELEEKIGFSLREVSIAAAGRSLKTISAHYEKEIDEDSEIEPTVCKTLEMEAVKSAYQLLKEEKTAGEEEVYLCVGYTVVNYYLNGYTITNLLGHSGKKIAVDILATFLPNSVVNSLNSVLEKVDLYPISLTLEPIAASRAIVPESFRLLNIALLDIGAGTSDIAIAKDGSIVAYGMVPIAGDEITEALSDLCLADFNTADYIKREIYRGNDISFKDILGNEKTVSCKQLLEELDPFLEEITDKISQEIIRLNGNKRPKSVLCVGGGGQVPKFTEKIAAKLGLSADRVGLKSRNAIPGIITDENELSGPEGVTVVGIAQVAIDNLGQNFITVNINGNEYKLFNSRELTVFDALGRIDYNIGDLVGRTGKDLRFYLNNERQVFFGELSEPAKILINDQQASLKSVLNNGDRIVIQKAIRGLDAEITVDSLMADYSAAACLVNGCEVDLSREISEGDRVEIVTAAKYEEGSMTAVKVKDTLTNFQEAPFSGQAIFEKNITVKINGEEYQLTGRKEYMFIDIFNHIEIEKLRLAGGSKIKLLINGKKAGYTDRVEDGDIIEIEGFIDS
ncbi:MAG: cell division protein FtsA [Peptococcaceae bacterium]|nr:cell division protein FtsA [Peptococcaceae bacterium]